MLYAATPTRAFVRIEEEYPVDNIREMIPGTEWEFTVHEPMLLIVRGLLGGEYIADENGSGLDPALPISFSAQARVLLDNVTDRVVGGIAFNQGQSQGENIRDAKHHYQILPIHQVDIVPSGTHTVGMTLRSGNRNVPGTQVLAIVKDNQNLIEYEILPVGQPYS